MPEPDRVHHAQGVTHPLFEGGNARRTVGQSGATLVEADEAGE
jgi:hypothetical protein